MDLLVDRLAGDVVLRHVPGCHVLDLGHGAPRVTQWVQPRAASLRVVDAIDLGRTPEVRLPFGDETFDLVYCLRTLAHLGFDGASSEQAARSALSEIGRILVPGGTALVQFDNPRSLWGAYHGLRNAKHAVEAGPLVIESDRGVTRFDTIRRFMDLLPPNLTMTDFHGLRVFIGLPQTLAIPIVGRLLQRLEWFVRDRAPIRGFGAHLLTVLIRG